MAEYTLAEITTALAAVVAAVDDVGVVITDRRTVEGEESEALTLLESLNNGVAHGWFVCLVRINEVDTNNGCEVQQTLTFQLESIYPFQHRRDDDTTSETGFGLMIGEVFAAARLSRTLGLDNKVFHKLLQSESDLQVKSWEATGGDGVLTHYARMRIEVQHAVFV